MENKIKESLPDIKQSVLISAPIQKVWEAVATSDGIAAWFMPNDFQPIKGHEFHLNSGQYGMSPCKVTEIDPPNSLTFNWDKNWKVTFELKEIEDQTEFTVIHSGWAPPLADIRNNMNLGWSQLVIKLRNQIEA